MEDNKKDEGQKCPVCHGMHGHLGCWGYGGHGRHFLLRIIIMLAIIALVFSVGVKLGELKSYFGGGYYGNLMMRGYGGNFDQYYQGYPMGPWMMYGGSGWQPATTSTLPR
ncbi:MAG: hypothetical protein AAB655_01265 [Patescibacteria group bacterium]